ncbi:hypothetical protein V6N13_053291 [Hibiscus sabdariffa]
MSDKQKGLVESILDIFPNGEYRTRVRHLYSNFKSKPENQGKALKDCLRKAARATYMKEWTDAVNEMKMILESRDKPILTMMEMIRSKLMTRIVAKKEAAEKIIGTLCPKIQKKMNPSYPLSLEGLLADLNRRKEPDEPVTKTGRIRKIGAQMTCSKCGNRGHNKRSCRGKVGGNTSSNNNTRVAPRRTIRVAQKRTANRSNTSAHDATTAHARTSSTNTVTEPNKVSKLPVRRPTMSNPATSSSYP